MRKRTPSCQDIIKELSKVKYYGVKSIVIHYGQGTIPYRTDRIGSSKSKDDLLDFICNCSMLGNNVKRVSIDHFAIPTSYPLIPRMEWSIYLVISNYMSKETNLSPEVIEALYNSFENEKAH